MERLAEILTLTVMQDFVNTYGWVWPLAEVIHYVGMSLLIGIIGLVDLRIIGLFRALPLAAMRPLVPVAIVAFVCNALTGLVFVTGNAPGGAEFYVLNLSFQLKVAAMFLAFVNLLIFRLTGLEEQVYAVPANGSAPPAAKVVAAVSLTSWVFTIIFGRLLMYNDTLLYFLGL